MYIAVVIVVFFNVLISINCLSLESMIMNLWADFATNTTQTPIKISDENHHNKETYMTTVELARKSGYPCEEHLVVTEDGYILTVHRIPIGRVPSNQINLRPPVLLMHGLLATSDCWMLTPPDQTLAFLLADSGYDIWLANVRGNYYSQKHTKLSTNQSEYWNFSFHEMGLYDLSATINYILSVTGEKRLFYIGISMGTTIFYVLASSRPEYNSKIRAMFSLGPAAYYGTLRLPLFKFVKSRTSLVLKILSMIGSYGLLPRIRLTADIAEKYCGDGSQTQDQCTQLFALVSGEPLDKINKTAIPFYISHFFSGTSRKTLAHYSQNIASEEFQLYDYKYGGNVMNYGMTKPPKYNLSLITAPVALHYSQDDQLVHPNDRFWYRNKMKEKHRLVKKNLDGCLGVKKLQEELPNCIGTFEVPTKNFSHVGFLIAQNVKDLVYDLILDIMKNY